MLEKITKKKQSFIIFLVVSYLVATGVSWAGFSLISSLRAGKTLTPDEISSVREKVGEGLPKTETCPINGAKYSKPEREIWETRRPITAIIENHVDSRPPSGLSRADVIYEAVAEGGITRFLSVFYCGAAAQDLKVAPVRSARIYFINYAAGYGDYPLFVHVGGANNSCPNCPGGVKPAGQVAREVRAVEKLGELGWRVKGGNDFDTIFDTGFPILTRDYERLGKPVASEHTMVLSTDALYEEAASRGFGYKDENGQVWSKNFQPWKYTEDEPASSPDATSISFEFWTNKPEYNVMWKYDTQNNSYLRFNGGKEHTDLETGEQLSAKNVVIVFVSERGPVDKEGHMYYEVLGDGDALVFQNGTVIEAQWEKELIDDSLLLFDSSGEEISFVPGTVWIEAVPSGNEIEY